MHPNPYINEDLQALAETVRRFATERVAPGFLERDKTRELDRTLLREMGELGFICPELPEAYGGLGMGCVAAGVIHEEVARADLSFSYLNLLASLNGHILSTYGNPEVVGPWLRKLVAGQAICAIALTEPRGGSDAANLRLRIERDGDHYVINGEKTSISAADQADITVVFGRTGTPESKAHGVTALLVPMDTPGITTNRFDCHGQRAIGRGSIFFENVRVPVGNMLLGEGRGFEIAQGRLGPGRIHHCMRSIGAAERALELMCKRLNSRVAFGREVARQTVWQERVAEARCMIEQALRWLRIGAEGRFARTENARLFKADRLAVGPQPLGMVQGNRGHDGNIGFVSVDRIQATTQADFQHGRLNPCRCKDLPGGQGAKLKIGQRDTGNLARSFNFGESGT